MDEMNKLHKMLTAAGISHTYMAMDPNLYGAGARQIRIYRDDTHTEELDDVIYHRYSHGYKQGLLETYNLGECDGFETAKQVFMGWMEKYFS